MIKRYYYDGLGEDIYDSEIDDYPSTLTICETLNQQDRRIEELLKANDSFGVIGNIIMEHYGKKDLCAKDVEDYANHIKEQDHKIAVLERALKLACKRYWDDCGMEDCPYGENESFDTNNKKCQSCSDNSGMTENKDGCCWVEFFKSQAESDIKNEKE